MKKLIQLLVLLMALTLCSCLTQKQKIAQWEKIARIEKENAKNGYVPTYRPNPAYSAPVMIYRYNYNKPKHK